MSLLRGSFNTITRLTGLWKKQLKVFEDSTMFQQRIVCHRLPKSPDRNTADLEQKQRNNIHKKMIQELERLILNVELKDYDRSYKKELLKLKQ